MVKHRHLARQVGAFDESASESSTDHDNLIRHTINPKNEAVVDVSPPIACHGDTRGSLFGLQRMQNSTVNARDSRFILVWTLDRDRVIALRPVGVSLCVGLIVKSCLPGTLPSFI